MRDPNFWFIGVLNVFNFHYIVLSLCPHFYFYEGVYATFFLLQEVIQYLVLWLLNIQYNNSSNIYCLTVYINISNIEIC